MADNFSIFDFDSQDPEHLKRFVDYFYYARQHYYGPVVLPVRSVIEDRLQGKAITSSEVKQRCFQALLDGAVVGQLVVLMNTAVVDSQDLPVGQIGYFDCINDHATANSLFSSAAKWFLAQGIKTVWGPMNGFVHSGYRFMVDGFDKPPYLYEPRNPEYYPMLWREAGFQVSDEWKSTLWDLYGERELLYRGFARPEENRGKDYWVEHPDPADKSTLRRVYQLLLTAWKGNRGLPPITYDEFIHYYGDMFDFMEIGHVKIIKDAEGVDIAFTLMFSDRADSLLNFCGDHLEWDAIKMSAMEGQAQNLIAFSISINHEHRGKAAVKKMTQSVFESFYGLGVQTALMAQANSHVRWTNRVAIVDRTYALFEIGTKELSEL